MAFIMRKMPNRRPTGGYVLIEKNTSNSSHYCEFFPIEERFEYDV